MNYNFTSDDFYRAFSFAVEYYLDPSKGVSGRTNSEPRGFGATLDAFTRGKLVEIGIQRMIENIANNKKCVLDFDMKKPSEVRTEPDIIKIEENLIDREPNIFTEIKNTSINDRWIGVTDEQLKSMKSGANTKDIYTIYASVKGTTSNDNLKTGDFVGMYLKHISGLKIFNQFSSLKSNASLEFILSVEELEKYGTKFPAGDLTYETNLFQGPKNIHKKDGSLLSRIELSETKNDFNGNYILKNKEGHSDYKHGKCKITGNFKIYKKVNDKTTRHYINCLSDVKISSHVFGDFFLKKGKTYDFVLETVGRDPILKRNNIFIAKRRVYQLLEKGILKKPKETLSYIANNI